MMNRKNRKTVTKAESTGDLQLDIMECLLGLAHGECHDNESGSVLDAPHCSPETSEDNLGQAQNPAALIAPSRSDSSFATPDISNPQTMSPNNTIAHSNKEISACRTEADEALSMVVANQPLAEAGNNDAEHSHQPYSTKAIAMPVKDFVALIGVSISTVYSWMSHDTVGKAEIMGKTYVWITEQHDCHLRTMESLAIESRDHGYKVVLEFEGYCLKARYTASTNKTKNKGSNK